MGELEDLDPERIWRGCNFHSTCFGIHPYGGNYGCYQSAPIFGDAAVRLVEQMASARATAGRDDLYEVVIETDTVAAERALRSMRRRLWAGASTTV